MAKLSSLLLFASVADAVPADPHWFEQVVDHFSTSTATFRQRYYIDDSHFGGPGSPIFFILGGEGAIPPSTGIFYPFISEVLAKSYHALVIELEHRFYGESLPFGSNSFTQDNLRIMNSQQALADAANFARAQQATRNCTDRGTGGYCPILTIGGSYPGFLSAMMRLRYPAVVDMAYAASAPMKFYSQQVGQYDYYRKVTESAERSLHGCPQAVLQAFTAMEIFLANSTLDNIVDRFSVCRPLPNSVQSDSKSLSDDLLFLAEQAFANLNMANYPPDNSTALHKTCKAFVQASQIGGSALLDSMRALLHNVVQGRSAIKGSSGRAFFVHGHHTEDVETTDRCFDLGSQLPSGANATARCGDWSGCGTGHDGEMWDYQTCSFEVEHIGFTSHEQMFPLHPWTTAWLATHCAKRFQVVPQPLGLTNLWGFDVENLRAQSSRIVFTNGLNDGWSVGGILDDIDAGKDLISINLPNGAHHSDLSHALLPQDTPDIKAAHSRIEKLIGKWLAELQGVPTNVIYT